MHHVVMMPVVMRVVGRGGFRRGGLGGFRFGGNGAESDHDEAESE